jgi:hypothetical protein
MSLFSPQYRENCFDQPERAFPHSSTKEVTVSSSTKEVTVSPSEFLRAITFAFADIAGHRVSTAAPSAEFLLQMKTDDDSLYEFPFDIPTFPSDLPASPPCLVKSVKDERVKKVKVKKLVILECNKCLEVFTDKLEIKPHKKTHTRSQELRCSDCEHAGKEARFKKASDLKVM